MRENFNMKKKLEQMEQILIETSQMNEANMKKKEEETNANTIKIMVAACQQLLSNQE